MAVYRSDQAQFTFAAEAGPGGYPEIATGDAYTTSTTSAGSRPIYPGDKSIGVVSASNIEAATVNKRFIAIGVDSKAETGITVGTMPSDTEVRRVVYVDGTEIHLDAPLAFPHKSGCQVKTITETTSGDLQTDLSGVVLGTAATQTDKLITWVPGVYDTIDTPDPQEAMEARYMLGQNTNRNAYQIFKGQQTFSGSVGGMVLLNGMPLRFPLGKVVTKPSSISDLANTRFYGQAGSTRGVIVVSSGTPALNAGDTIVIDYTATPTATSTMEVRQIVGFTSPASGTTISGTTICQLNYPLFFDHTSAGTVQTVGSVYGTSSPVAGNFTHHIFEQVDLSRVSWNVNVKDENGANAFQRRYYGGLIGGMTISAEEGGLLTCGWDTATFLGMVHSVQDAARSTAPVRKFAGMHDIAKTDIGSPLFPTAAASEIGDRGLPSTEPYYFSEGNVKMWGQTIARVRNFSINVTNGEEVRYYVRRADPDNRGPFEVRPGQRGYTMTATIGLPNAGTTGNGMTDADTMSLWKELILSGDYTAASSSSATGHAGFNIELQFTRGANDTLTIRIPNDYTGASEDTGASAANQGAFIQTAPVPIDGAVPLEQSANIIFKSMKIEIADQEPFYP